MIVLSENFRALFYAPFYATMARDAFAAEGVEIEFVSSPRPQDAARRLEIQSDFTTQLVDVLKEGVGNLVDADLAAESAQVEALGIRQQLGIAALSIANGAPGAILSLFQSRES